MDFSTIDSTFHFGIFFVINSNTHYIFIVMYIIWGIKIILFELEKRV